MHNTANVLNATEQIAHWKMIHFTLCEFYLYKLLSKKLSNHGTENCATTLENSLALLDKDGRRTCQDQQSHPTCGSERDSGTCTPGPTAKSVHSPELRCPQPAASSMGRLNCDSFMEYYTARKMGWAYCNDMDGPHKIKGNKNSKTKRKQIMCLRPSRLGCYNKTAQTGWLINNTHLYFSQAGG